MSSDERGTPSYIIEAAREVMGTIDLDPASCATANEVVRAARYYTKEQDGLTQPWFGNVWLNPPFSNPLCRLFMERLPEEYHAGRITQAVAIVNASSGRWFHRLLGEFPSAWPNHSRYCPSGRVEFYTLPGNDRNSGANRYPNQTIFYLGYDIDLFRRVFGEFCTIPWPPFAAREIAL